MTTLDVAVEEILDAIVDAITAATNETGGGLDEVQAVVRGDRARPMPATPAIWVVPQAAQATQEEFGGDEAWRMLVSIAALVKSDSPDTGGRVAQRLSARAAAIARDARPAGGYVIDVRPDSFDPTARSSERNRNLFWTDATVSVWFTVEGD